MTPELQRLLETTVDSFEKLEILRSLWKPDASPWSIDRLAEKMHTSYDHVVASLTELAKCGLVASTATAGEYVAAKDSVLAPRIAELFALYDDDPLAIMRIINDVAVRRIRSMAAKTFADSFVMKAPKTKEPDDG